MKNIVVTGATGFIGYYLLKKLQKEEIFVYAVVRPNSKNLYKLKNFKNIKVIELPLSEISKLGQMIEEKCEVFYHLAWDCENFDFQSQQKNIQHTINALETARAMGCERFVGSGSQAEYGIYNGLITEDNTPNPVTAYGTAKLAACYLSQYRARELKIEWIWGRIFSVYGPGDKKNSLISYLINTLSKKETPTITRGEHPWDYLYVTDAADALYSLGRVRKVDTVYNIANGDGHQLKYYIGEVYKMMRCYSEPRYGARKKVIVPLNVSSDKLKKNADWRPQSRISGRNKGEYDVNGLKGKNKLNRATSQPKCNKM